MNRFFVSGVISKEPELNAFSKTGKYCTFSLANKVNQKQGNEWVDKDTYFNLVAFGNVANLVKNNCNKGDSVSCECEIIDGSYEKDGKKVYKYSFIVKSISYQPKKSTNKVEKVSKDNDYNSQIGDDDGIPF